MKKKFVYICALAAVVCGVSAQAVSSFTPTLKEIAVFGPEYVKDEFAMSEEDGGVLKFVFNGQPADHLKKAIQIYCKVWDLKPGEYTLTFQMKTNLEELKFPMCLNGTTPEDDSKMYKLAEYIAPAIGREWTEVSFPVKVPEGKAKHGYLDMRVGEIANGTELYLKPPLAFTPVK